MKKDIPTIRVLMVGPRGVGKTSMVTAMYDRFKNELGEYNAKLMAPNSRIAGLLEDHRQSLTKLAKSGSSGLTDKTVGIAGGSAEMRFLFGVDIDGKNGFRDGPEFNLELIDLPGGFYTGDCTEEQANALEQTFASAHISILAVDANALMEGSDQVLGFPGNHHETINSPKLIFEAYERALSKAPDNGNHSHVVIITAIRAESYVSDREALFNVLKNAYTNNKYNLLELFRNNKVVCYACAVETVGTVRFHSWEDQNGRPCARFTAGGDYAPRDCELPLREALFHSGIFSNEQLSEITEQQRKNVLDRIGRWLGFPVGSKEGEKKIARIAEVVSKIAKKREASEKQGKLKWLVRKRSASNASE